MPVDYHAWTHRPKALGGTDPIETDSEIKYIVCKDINTGQTFATGWSDILWQVNVNPNPECFEPLDTEFDPDFNQIRILEDGLYTVSCHLAVDTNVDHFVSIYSVENGTADDKHHRTFPQIRSLYSAGELVNTDQWEYTFRMDGTGGANRVIEFQMYNPGASFDSYSSGGFYCELRKWPGTITMTGRNRETNPG